MKLGEIREVIWPRLDEDDPTLAGQRAEQRKADLDEIKSAVLKAEHLDVLITEAHRVADDENARRTGADTRATTYLAILGVLAPVLVALTPTALAAGSGIARPIVTLVLFVAMSAYILWFGLWSFRVLTVAAMARLDPKNLIDLWTEQDPRTSLIKELLYCVRWNREPVNRKITCLKMAHEFGVRALVAFVFATLVRVGWDPVVALAKAVASHL